VRTIGPSDRDDADLSPVLHERGAARLTSSALLLVSESVAGRVRGRRWIHPRAEQVLSALLADAIEPTSSRDETAIVEPGAVVFPGVRLGKRVVIGAGSIVGRPGFRFVDDARMPHRAGVVIEDDVELGALCTIDAGVLSPTTIGHKTKLDAQVHVGHGVVIGARCRIAAQVGLAGSVAIEDDVWIGGQAGIADHCRIGRGARIAAKAGVIGDIEPGAVVAGYPAVARARWLRGHARLYRR
jgi:UDP-3-O-[3-hydroxymyristoyl] glucosamine N-acyltransferase